MEEGGGEGDVWLKKCALLKRKCEEYEEKNDNLLAQTKKICRIIERTEKEKSFLVKRLEQFEVLDEIPRSRFSLNSDILSEVLVDEKALLMSAAKIRSELNAELAHLRPLGDDHDSKFLSVSGNTRYATGSASPVNYPLVSTSSQSQVTSTPLHSPVASVMTTPSSLVPASVPVLSSTATTSMKGKKPKMTKGHTRPLAPTVKRKGHKGSGLMRRKKPDADPNAPKKPSNAFFWFCQENRAPLQEQFRGEGMSGQHDLTKALAKLWSETDTETKKKYYHKYTADKARYDKEMKEYTSMVKQGTMDADSSNDSFTL